jgi:CDP-diacylglycerol--glycerol-3-phosphate 3-phosphatidyltransferase
MKFVPNILSCLRIVFSLVLLTLPEKPLSFAVVYVCCGASDVADGFIARKFKVASNLGAKLDSLADLAFTVASLCSLIFFTDILQNSFVLGCITLVLVIRVANLIATHNKFHQWAALHTVGNKLTNILLFFAIPICIVLDSFPLGVVLPIVAIALVSALEETTIIHRCSTYDIDIPNYQEARKTLM